jgi:hypothetical protein
MFGPHRRTKVSGLLQMQPRNNLALRCLIDLLEHGSECCYFSAVQIYQEKLIDLLRAPLAKADKSKGQIYQPVRSLNDFGRVL